MTRKHADLPSPADLVDEMHRLSREVDKALGFLHETAQRWAVAENDYRMARAKLQLEAEGRLQSEHGIDKPTVDEKRAFVDLHTPKQRLEAHMQDAMKSAAHEAVRARRAQLSALQSAAAAVRVELELAGKGPAAHGGSN